MAAQQGFEPQLSEPETGVLPLDDWAAWARLWQKRECSGGLSGNPALSDVELEAKKGRALGPPK